MSVEIAWKQNNLVTDFHLLKLLQVVCGLGLQTFVCDFNRQNICSVTGVTFKQKIYFQYVSFQIALKKYPCYLASIASLSKGQENLLPEATIF